MNRRKEHGLPWHGGFPTANLTHVEAVSDSRYRGRASERGNVRRLWFLERGWRGMFWMGCDGVTSRRVDSTPQAACGVRSFVM
jgi:hypothetical protein